MSGPISKSEHRAPIRYFAPYPHPTAGQPTSSLHITCSPHLPQSVSYSISYVNGPYAKVDVETNFIGILDAEYELTTGSFCS